MVVDGMALIGDGSYMMVIRIPICLRGSRRCRWLAALNCHNGDNPGVRQWEGDPDARASEVCYGILPGPWAGLSSTREGGAYRNNEGWWSEVARRMVQPRNNLRSKNALGGAVVVCRVDGSVAVPAPRTDGKAGSPVRCGSWGMGDGGWGPISGQFPGRAGVDTWKEIHCPSLFQELLVACNDGQASRCHGPSVGVYTSSLHGAQCQRLWGAGSLEASHKSGELMALGPSVGSITEECSGVSFKLIIRGHQGSTEKEKNPGLIQSASGPGRSGRLHLSLPYT